MPSRRMRRRDESGAAAVEFALIMPLLVLIVFGIMQFGLYFYRYQGMQSMAHEGARGGAIGLTVAEITTRIRGAMSIPADFDDLTIDVVLIDEVADSEVSRIDGKTSVVAEQNMAVCEGVANPRDYTIRVEVSILDTVSDYDVIIPLWGRIDTDYGSAAAFSCGAAS